MGSTPDTELWVICPICHHPNPEGTEFCEHCWGAALHDSPVFSTQEAQEISRRKLARQKRIKVMRVIAVSLGPLIAIAVIVFLSLYSLTDVIFKPPQSLNSNSPPGQWTMFRHDLNRSGTADSGSTLPQGTVEWTFSTGAAIHSSPAVADNTVYIGSRDNKLYALDATTGAKRWEYTTGSWVESSPTVANGVVYFGSNDGKLYALDAATGEKIWDFKTAYAIVSSPAVADGVVYFGGDDYFLYALDAADGTKLWAFNAKGTVKSSPAIANGIIYIGSGSGFTYALDARDGKLRLRFLSHYQTFSSPAVQDNIFYISHSDGYLFAIDGYARTWPREHKIKPFWIQAYIMGIPWIPTPPPQSGLLWGFNLGKATSSSPTIANDTLYTGTDNKLLAIDIQSLQQLWEFEAEGSVRSSPAVAGTTVYVGSEDGRLYAIDTTSGRKIWDILTGDMITSSPAVTGGTVYIGSHDGNVYAIK